MGWTLSRRSVPAVTARASDPLRLPTPGDRNLRAIPRPDVFEHPLVVAIGEIRRGTLIHDGEVQARPAVIQADEPLRLVEGQRLQQHAVDHAEDRGVGADADRQREKGHGAERRAAPQRAQRVAEVARQAGEPRQPSLVAHGVQRLRDTAGPNPRRARSVVARATAALFVFGRQVEVQAELLFEIVVGSAPTQRSREADQEFTENAHLTPPVCHASPRSSECMMAAMRSQACFSFDNWRRPAGVSA